MTLTHNVPVYQDIFLKPYSGLWLGRADFSARYPGAEVQGLLGQGEPEIERVIHASMHERMIFLLAPSATGSDVRVPALFIGNRINMSDFQWASSTGVIV